MARLKDSDFYKEWLIDNEEMRERLENVLDEFCISEREIIKAFLGVKNHAFLVKPSIKKIAVTLKIPYYRLYRMIRKIREKLPPRWRW